MISSAGHSVVRYPTMVHMVCPIEANRMLSFLSAMNVIKKYLKLTSDFYAIVLCVCSDLEIVPTGRLEPSNVLLAPNNLILKGGNVSVQCISRTNSI